MTAGITAFQMATGNKTSVLAGAFSALVLCGCVSQQQDAELLQNLRSAELSETSIAGAQLRACFASSPKLLAKIIGPDSVAHYSEAITYEFASLMKRSPEEISQYAKFIRGYVYPYENTSIFGTRQFNAICYFGDLGNGPKFAAMIITDSLGSVNKSELAGALVDTYKNLSGEKVPFIKEATLIMSTPK